MRCIGSARSRRSFVALGAMLSYCSTDRISLACSGAAAMYTWSQEELEFDSAREHALHV
jgi:hypothetical protein